MMKNKNRLIYTFLFCLISHLTFSQKTGFDTYLMVRASKLSIREQPNLQSNKLGIVDKGEIVKLLSQRTEREYIDVVDGIKDSWVKMEYKGIVGFMFGGYLSYSQVYSPNSDWTGKYLFIDGEHSNFSNELVWFGIYEKEDGSYMEEVHLHFEFKEEEPGGGGGIFAIPVWEEKKKYRWLIGTREKMSPGKVGIRMGAFAVNSNLYHHQTRLPVPFFKQNGLLNTDLFLSVNVTATDNALGYNCYNGAYKLDLIDSSPLGTIRLHTFKNLLPYNISCPSVHWFGDINGDEIPDFIFFQNSNSMFWYRLYVSKLSDNKITYEES